MVYDMKAQDKQYKFKFSVVMAVYNVAGFLAESIESVIAQTIGFEKNVQLILVDDGSSDQSGEIVDRYAAKWPANIVALHKTNGGVSSARNLGLEKVEGEFISFLDADDLLERHAMAKAWDFFKKFGDAADFAAIPIYFFDGKKGEHPLNGKFKDGTRLIDLREEWQALQMSVVFGFTRASAAKGIKFDCNLKYAEDAKFLFEILKKKPFLGVVCDTAQYYRKRTGGETSALQDCAHKSAWYMPTIRAFHQEIASSFKDESGKLPLYFQNAIMYELQWRFKLKSIVHGVISAAEEAEYLKSIKDLARGMDDKVIVAQEHCSEAVKLHILAEKHGKAPESRFADGNIVFKYGDTQLGDAKTLFSPKLEFAQVKGDALEIEGSLSEYPMLGELLWRFEVGFNGEYQPLGLVFRKEGASSLGEMIEKIYTFKFSAPIPKKGKSLDITFRFEAPEGDVEIEKLNAGCFFPVSRRIPWQSWRFGECKLVFPHKNTISIMPSGGVFKRFFSEAMYLLFAWKSGIKNAKKGCILRIIANFARPFFSKNIWILEDRATQAGDNAEALFRYLVAEKNENRKLYFIIHPSSPDYEQLKAAGPVLDRYSVKHLLAHLFAKVHISSHADDQTLRPFGYGTEIFRDMLANRKFVFLQHGITQNDISGWLNRYNKNFSGFVTAAKREYAAISDPKSKYFYPKEKIWLTGFARYDRLENGDKNSKVILLMPTWRKYLLTSREDVRPARWVVNPGFTESRYFRFYNGLINDSRLLASCRNNGYKIVFALHPAIKSTACFFDVPEEVEILDSTRNRPYRELFAEGSLAVTDYSSAVFDFAYLRKCVIYTQFDFDELFSGDHVCKEGYFDYNRDGFGEVETTLEGTVARIIEYIENGCKLKDKYRQRIEEFYAFNDKENCARIVEKINSLLGQ